MIKNYTIKMTKQAQEQLHDITHYIASDLKAPDASLNLLNFLENSIMSLNHFPQRIALINEEPWRSNKIRRMPIKNFLIYFCPFSFSPLTSCRTIY